MIQGFPVNRSYTKQEADDKFASAGLQWSTTPATPTTTASSGEIAYDDNYFYVAVADNTWKRVALSTWTAVDYYLLNENGVDRFLLEDSSGVVLLEA
jgi:hypothetical protein